MPFHRYGQKRLPCVKGAPAKQVRDCSLYTRHSDRREESHGRKYADYVKRDTSLTLSMTFVRYGLRNLGCFTTFNMTFGGDLFNP